MTDTLRVAQVLTASTGGIGRHAAGLTRRLLERGHVVMVWCPSATAEQHLAGLVDAGLRIRSLADLARPGGALAGADVVHAHGYKATALALPTAHRVPLVSSWHNDVPPARRGGGTVRTHLAGLALQRLSARADLVLGASGDLVEAARRLGAHAELGPVAAPDLAPARLDRTDVRHRLGTSLSTRVVITVGRLAPQKNLEMVLEVATQLSGRTDLEFWVVGAGPGRDRLAHTIEERRLPVRLLGQCDDVADLLRAADVALLTSRWEARALVAQEALAAGVALVATDVGGIAELVGDAAVLVAPGDVAAAAAAVERLTNQPASRSRLGRLGLARAATWPDEDEVAILIEQHYRRLLESSCRGGGASDSAGTALAG